MSRRAAHGLKRHPEKRRRNRNRLLVLAVVVLLLVPLPRSGGVWYLNGLLFWFFDFINARFFPENF